MAAPLKVSCGLLFRGSCLSFLSFLGFFDTFSFLFVLMSFQRFFTEEQVLRMVLSECEEDKPPDLNEFSNDSETANSESEIVDEDEQDETVNFEDLNVTLEEQ